MGRLGRDPELRYTQAGRPVASFSLAVDRDFKDKASGERATDWIPVVAWEARAKFVQQYFQIFKILRFIFFYKKIEKLIAILFQSW